LIQILKVYLYINILSDVVYNLPIKELHTDTVIKYDLKRFTLGIDFKLLDGNKCNIREIKLTYF